MKNIDWLNEAISNNSLNETIENVNNIFKSLDRIDKEFPLDSVWDSTELTLDENVNKLLKKIKLNKDDYPELIDNIKKFYKYKKSIESNIEFKRSEMSPSIKELILIEIMYRKNFNKDGLGKYKPRFPLENDVLYKKTKEIINELDEVGRIDLSKILYNKKVKNSILTDNNMMFRNYINKNLKISKEKTDRRSMGPETKAMMNRIGNKDYVLSTFNSFKDLSEDEKLILFVNLNNEISGKGILSDKILFTQLNKKLIENEYYKLYGNKIESYEKIIEQLYKNETFKTNVMKKIEEQSFDIKFENFKLLPSDNILNTYLFDVYLAGLDMIKKNEYYSNIYKIISSDQNINKSNTFKILEEEQLNKIKEGIDKSLISLKSEENNLIFEKYRLEELNDENPEKKSLKNVEISLEKIDNEIKILEKKIQNLEIDISDQNEILKKIHIKEIELKEKEAILKNGIDLLKENKQPNKKIINEQEKKLAKTVIELVKIKEDLETNELFHQNTAINENKKDRRSLFLIEKIDIKNKQAKSSENKQYYRLSNIKTIDIEKIQSLKNSIPEERIKNIIDALKNKDYTNLLSHKKEQKLEDVNNEIIFINEWLLENEKEKIFLNSSIDKINKIIQEKEELNKRTELLEIYTDKKIDLNDYPEITKSNLNKLKEEVIKMYKDQNQISNKTISEIQFEIAKEELEKDNTGAYNENILNNKIKILYHFIESIDKENNLKKLNDKITIPYQLFKLADEINNVNSNNDIIDLISPPKKYNVEVNINLKENFKSMIDKNMDEVLLEQFNIYKKLIDKNRFISNKRINLDEITNFKKIDENEELLKNNEQFKLYKNLIKREAQGETITIDHLKEKNIDIIKISDDFKLIDENINTFEDSLKKDIDKLTTEELNKTVNKEKINLHKDINENIYSELSLLESENNIELINHMKKIKYENILREKTVSEKIKEIKSESLILNFEGIKLKDFNEEEERNNFISLNKEISNELNFNEKIKNYITKKREQLNKLNQELNQGNKNKLNYKIFDSKYDLITTNDFIGLTEENKEITNLFDKNNLKNIYDNITLYQPEETSNLLIMLNKELNSLGLNKSNNFEKLNKLISDQYQLLTAKNLDGNELNNKEYEKIKNKYFEDINKESELEIKNNNELKNKIYDKYSEDLNDLLKVIEPNEKLLEKKIKLFLYKNNIKIETTDKKYLNIEFLRVINEKQYNLSEIFETDNLTKNIKNDIKNKLSAIELNLSKNNLDKYKMNNTEIDIFNKDKIDEYNIYNKNNKKIELKKIDEINKLDSEKQSVSSLFNKIMPNSMVVSSMLNDLEKNMKGNASEIKRIINEVKNKLDQELNKNKTYNEGAMMVMQNPLHAIVPIFILIDSLKVMIAVLEKYAEYNEKIKIEVESNNEITKKYYGDIINNQNKIQSNLKNMELNSNKNLEKQVIHIKTYNELNNYYSNEKKGPYKKLLDDISILNSNIENIEDKKSIKRILKEIKKQIIDNRQNDKLIENILKLKEIGEKKNYFNISIEFEKRIDEFNKLKKDIDEKINDRKEIISDQLVSKTDKNNGEGLHVYFYYTNGGTKQVPKNFNEGLGLEKDKSAITRTDSLQSLNDTVIKLSGMIKGFEGGIFSEFREQALSNEDMKDLNKLEKFNEKFLAKPNENRFKTDNDKDELKKHAINKIEEYFKEIKTRTNKNLLEIEKEQEFIEISVMKKIDEKWSDLNNGDLSVAMDGLKDSDLLENTSTDIKTRDKEKGSLSDLFFMSSIRQLSFDHLTDKKNIMNEIAGKVEDTLFNEKTEQLIELFKIKDLDLDLEKEELEKEEKEKEELEKEEKEKEELEKEKKEKEELEIEGM
jgi:hypothetical protein